MKEVTLSPPHKQAAKEAADEFAYGDLISLEWINDHSGIEFPKGRQLIEVYNKIALKKLSFLGQFIEEMLTEHKMSLKNVRGEGYRIVNPNEQADTAQEQFAKRLEKEADKAVNIINNTRHDMLDADGRKKSVDTLVRIQSVAMTGRRYLSGKEQPEKKQVGGTVKAMLANKANEKKKAVA